MDCAPKIRRAAVSIPANIVEGCARDSDREHSRSLEIAFGSTREWLYLIDLSKRLQLIDPPRRTNSCNLEGVWQQPSPR